MALKLEHAISLSLRFILPNFKCSTANDGVAVLDYCKTNIFRIILKHTSFLKMVVSFSCYGNKSAMDKTINHWFNFVCRYDHYLFTMFWVAFFSLIYVFIY